jgi:ABC-2 type transport system permease protein
MFRQVALLLGGALGLGGIIPAVFLRDFFNPWGASLLCAGLVVLVPAAILSFTPHLFTLMRRELGAYFLSPIAYMVLIAMTFLAGWSYFELCYQLTMPQIMFSGLEDPIVQYMGTNIWLLFCLLVLPGIVTMRLFSEERRSGSIELLMTAPLTEAEVVVSKFLSALVFYMILWAPWGLFLIGLYLKTPFDYLPVVSVYLGLALLGATFVSGGLFFSSLTRNQIIAFILTFAMMVLFLAIVVLQFYWEQKGFDRKWLDAMKYLSYYLQMREFGLGKIDIRYVVLHLSLSAFFLFGTIKVIETQKGK